MSIALTNWLGVTQEHRNEWADKAVEFKLPADFVAVVRGQ
jgi:hypothetical protein